jgi:hypothetical protein
MTLRYLLVPIEGPSGFLLPYTRREVITQQEFGGHEVLTFVKATASARVDRRPRPCQGHLVAATKKGPNIAVPDQRQDRKISPHDGQRMGVLKDFPGFCRHFRIYVVLQRN